MGLTTMNTSTMEFDQGSNESLEYAMEGEASSFPVLFVTVSTLICLTGIIGNSLVIVVTRNRMKGLHITMSVFIVNLSFADLLFLVFCVPTSAVYFTAESWPLGVFLCKMMDFLIFSSMLASIFTLVAMSLDRFSAVVYPLRLIQVRSITNAKIIVVVIWIISCTCALPYLIVNTVYHVPTSNNTNMTNMQYCVSTWSLETSGAYYTFIFAVGYVIPLYLIVCAYVLILRTLWKSLRIMNSSRESNMGKSKRKVTFMVSVIVLVFGLCWFPHHLIHLWQSYGTFPFNLGTYKLKSSSLCLSYLNSCLNPIIYSIMSQNFRKAMKKALQRCGDDPGGPMGSGHGRGTPGIRLTPVTGHHQVISHQNIPGDQKRNYPRRNYHRHRPTCSDTNRVQLTNVRPLTWQT